MEMQTKTKSGVFVFQNLKEDPEEIFLGQEEGENDLSYWEFINNSSDSDVDDVLSISDASWHSSLSSSPKDSSIPDSDVDHHQLDSEVFRDGYGEPYTGDQEEDVDGGGGGGGGDDEEEEDEEDGYDLDDELVPRSLSGKFGGRQRIRKLGKRAFAKMNTSKKSPYMYMKPGCVHGKHGLGLKHSF